MSTERTDVPAWARDTPRPATDPQKDYVKGLVERKDLSSLTQEQRDWLETMNPDELLFDHAQRIIPVLKELPWLPREQDSEQAVPAQMMAKMPHVENGRYAVIDTTKNHNDLHFFKVKNGNKPGFVFLDVYASDVRYPIYRLDHKLAVLTEIAKDPEGAMKKFGQEIGKCGRCGRTLTDPVSRAFGIGPDCREMMGL